MILHDTLASHDERGEKLCPQKLQSTKNAKKASHKCFACSVLIKHHCSFALHEINLKTKDIFLEANGSVKTRLVAIVSDLIR